MINVGLLGLGTVGRGVVKIMEDHKGYLEKLLKSEIYISKILVKDLDKKRDIKIDKGLLTIDPSGIIEDKDIDIVIETMGGLDEAYFHIKESLNRGKHVITANKAVVSKYLEELTGLAKEKNKAFLYEASVGGGMPIIKPLKEQSNINDIQEIKGILNGTSNYILTKMVSDNIGFKEALATSQELGYAEMDPTDDIEGYDTRRKLRILSSIAFKGKIDEEEISCSGISNINSNDIRNIKTLDCTVKLLGKTVKKDNKYYSSVEPVVLKKDSFLGKVDNGNNLVSFLGNRVGELRFYGEGAGSLPTANAIFSDLIDISTGSYEKNHRLVSSNLKNLNRLDQGKYYFRVTVEEDTIDNIEEYIVHREILEKMIEKKNGYAFITKHISKDKLEEAIQTNNIKANNYFIARIED